MHCHKIIILAYLYKFKRLDLS